MANDPAAYAAALMVCYSFDLGGYSIDRLMGVWLNDYSPNWVRLAAIEALYQGRYKAISVDQILFSWHRRGQPCPHFNPEFERLIGQFPQDLAAAEAVELEQGHSSLTQPELLQLPAPALAPVDRVSEATPGPAISSPSSPEAALPSDLDSPFLEDPAPSEALPLQEAVDLADAPAAIAVPITEAQEDAIAPRDSTPPAPLSDPTTEPTESSRPIYGKFRANARIAPVRLTDSTEAEAATQRPIHQFTPVDVSSEFYTKLKAVAHQSAAALADIANLGSVGGNAKSDSGNR